MKKTLSLVNCFLAFAILTMVFSCKKDLNKNPSPILTAPKDSNFVSLADATTAALQIPTSALAGNAMKTKQIDGTMAATSKQILDYTAYPNAVNTSLYIINYVGGGFVVIPADKRVEPILAISAKGHFSTANSLPTGLTNWLTTNHKNMQALRKNTVLARPKSINSSWAQLATPSTNTSGKVIDKAVPPVPTCEPSTTVYQVGPYLQTTWAQGVPYNQNPGIPLGNYYYGDYRDPVGCVATAMAQVMYYWKSPSSYNWAIMPLTSDSYTTAGETEISRLMYNIGLSVNMAYSPTGSAPVESAQNYIALGLAHSFNYTAPAFQNWNQTNSYMTVQSNLDSGEPVILTGATSTDGHAWVCDGYMQVTNIWCASDGDLGGGATTLLFDMNWGWNEAPVAGVTINNVDGWYDFDLWEVYNGNVQEYYQYDLTMTYNIHP